MTPQPLHPPFAQPFHQPIHQPYAAPVHPVAHDPWRWLLGPAAHAVTVVLLGLVLAIWATAADGDLGLVPSLLQSGLGVMGTPFSLSATVLDDTAPPAATAAVLVVTALVWVVPHAAVAYWRATR